MIVLQHALKLSESGSLKLQLYLTVRFENPLLKPPVSVELSIVKIKSGLLYSLLQIPSFLSRLRILSVSGSFLLPNSRCPYENTEASFLSGVS